MIIWILSRSQRYNVVKYAFMKNLIYVNLIWRYYRVSKVDPATHGFIIWVPNKEGHVTENDVMSQ